MTGWFTVTLIRLSGYILMKVPIVWRYHEWWSTIKTMTAWGICTRHNSNGLQASFAMRLRGVFRYQWCGVQFWVQPHYKAAMATGHLLQAPCRFIQQVKHTGRHLFAHSHWHSNSNMRTLTHTLKHTHTLTNNETNRKSQTHSHILLHQQS